jgi:hypothetical protein
MHGEVIVTSNGFSISAGRSKELKMKSEKWIVIKLQRKDMASWSLIADR